MGLNWLIVAKELLKHTNYCIWCKKQKCIILEYINATYGLRMTVIRIYMHTYMYKTYPNCLVTHTLPTFFLVRDGFCRFEGEIHYLIWIWIINYQNFAIISHALLLQDVGCATALRYKLSFNSAFFQYTRVYVVWLCLLITSYNLVVSTLSLMQSLSVGFISKSKSKSKSVLFCALICIFCLQKH